MGEVRKRRWMWYSATHGEAGPFGPIEAHTIAEATGIAKARANNAGVVLAYIVEDADSRTPDENSPKEDS